MHWRYLVPPAGLSEADAEHWEQQKRVPVRLRVCNFFRLWLESYWRPGTDNDVLDTLQTFARENVMEVFTGQAQRLEEYISCRRAGADSLSSSPVSELYRIRDAATAAMPFSPPVSGGGSSNPPASAGGLSEAAPRVSTTRAGNLKARNFVAITITDFDETELARQLTLMESVRYCAVTVEEMLEGGIGGRLKDSRKGKAPTPNVKVVSALSTAVTGWVSESILGEQDVNVLVLEDELWAGTEAS